MTVLVRWSSAMISFGLLPAFESATTSAGVRGAGAGTLAQPVRNNAGSSTNRQKPSVLIVLCYSLAMSGNSFGTLYCVTSFGESHGPAYGGVVDGCPPGMALEAADLQQELDRR